MDLNAIQAALVPVVVNAIEALKNSPSFPLRAETKLANRLASIIAALTAVAGITVITAGGLQAGGSLCVYVPPVQQVAEFSVRVLLQHWGQKLYYHTVARKVAPAQ